MTGTESMDAERALSQYWVTGREHWMTVFSLGREPQGRSLGRGRVVRERPWLVLSLVKELPFPGGGGLYRESLLSWRRERREVSRDRVEQCFSILETGTSLYICPIWQKENR